MSLSGTATRFVAWLALGCHVLVASGLPIPVSVTALTQGSGADRAPGKDRSRPFPCMDKPCGCATAEQCFASCCCHTPAERLAWAKAHAVEPAVVAALERRVTAAAAPAAGCCAAATRTPSCCAADHAAPDAREVSRDDRSPVADPVATADPANDQPGDTPGPGVVILRDMLACGGILTAWLACGTALPPPPRVAPPTHDAPAGGLVIADEFSPSVCAAPTAPPPRVG